MNRERSVVQVGAPSVEVESTIWIAVHPDGRRTTLTERPHPEMTWGGRSVTVLEYRLVGSAVYPLESRE